MRRDGRLDTGASRPAETPYERRLARTGHEIDQRLLVVGPGKPARRIKQPASRRVADATAHRTGREHSFAEILRAECRRREIRAAANRKAGKAWKVRERRVGFAADENAVRQHVIVAALDSRQKASGFVKRIDRLIEACRARDAGCRPVGGPPRTADVAARIKAVPVISRAGEGNRQSLRHHNCRRRRRSPRMQ